jgi:hypothetical protein
MQQPAKPPFRPIRLLPIPIAHESSTMSARSYRLIGADGNPYTTTEKGSLGGHRRTKIYGRLDCSAALRAIARGGPYPRYRVFFVDEETATRAGYRPCAVCMRSQYDTWKKRARR